MRPVLFELGPFRVPTHEFFTLAGVAVAAAVVVAEARRRGRLDERFRWVIAGALLGAAAGARLATLWSYLVAAPDPSVTGAALEGGKSVLGGLPGAYVGAVLAKRLVGYRSSTGDLFAPGVALGLAVGRVGCFFTERIGTPTTLPWGLAVGPEVAARIPDCRWCATGVAMHPSMLYEIVFHLVMFAVLMALRGRLRVEGDLFKLSLLAYATFRFGVEFVRGAPEVAAGLTRPQLFLIPSTLVLVAYFARRVRPGPRPLPARALEV